MDEMIRTLVWEHFTKDEMRKITTLLDDTINTVDASENVLYQPFLESLKVLKDIVDDAFFI